MLLLLSSLYSWQCSQIQFCQCDTKRDMCTVMHCEGRTTVQVALLCSVKAPLTLAKHPVQIHGSIDWRDRIRGGYCD
jgi:hypothetical protein